MEAEPNLLNLILSIGALGQGWTSSKYLVVATTSDGRNFPVHSSDFEEDAKYTRYALERQLADFDGDAAEWAESKGYDQLTEHLRVLRS